MGAILVVEDDDDIREDVADLLRGEGFAVVAARDGLDALARLPEIDQLCVVLLDLMMPRLDGLGFGARLREDARHAGVPVVIVSGAGALREPARSLGAADGLVKPFRIDQLLGVVQRYCRA